MDLKEIISGCQNRNLQAERELFYLYAKKVHALARKYTHDLSEADDMMQECFIKVYGQIQKYEEEKGKFEAWMYRVCVNTILQMLRAKKGNHISSLPIESVPEVADVDDDYLEIPSHLIQSAMDGLPKGYKDVFYYFVMEGWSHKQIAAQMKITEGTSRSQLTKAKRYLRNFINANTVKV